MFLFFSSILSCNFPIIIYEKACAIHHHSIIKTFKCLNFSSSNIKNITFIEDYCRIISREIYSRKDWKKNCCKWPSFFWHVRAIKIAVISCVIKMNMCISNISDRFICQTLTKCSCITTSIIAIGYQSLIFTFKKIKLITITSNLPCSLTYLVT